MWYTIRWYTKYGHWSDCNKYMNIWVRINYPEKSSNTTYQNSRLLLVFVLSNRSCPLLEIIFFLPVKPTQHCILIGSLYDCAALTEGILSKWFNSDYVKIICLFFQYFVKIQLSLELFMILYYQYHLTSLCDELDKFRSKINYHRQACYIKLHVG